MRLRRPARRSCGWLDREQLADAYASADLFLFCSRTDTYGQVIAEAQASGLPVVAVGEGGPADADPRPSGRAGCAIPTRMSSPRRSRSWPPRASSASALAQAALAAVERPHLGGGDGQLAAGYGARRARTRASPGPRRSRRSPDECAAVACGGRWSHSPRPRSRLSSTSSIRPRSRARPRTSRIRLSTSTASSPGSTSTTGSCSSPRTRRSRCSSGSSSPRSGSRTWTRSSWSGSPTCSDMVESGTQAKAADGMSPTETLAAVRARALDQRERAGRAVERELRPALAEHGIRILTPEQASPEEREELDAAVRAPGVPGADAAGDRPRPSVPVHLQPLALARRRAPRPGEGQRDPRPGQGAEGASAPVPRRRRRTATRWSRSTR